MLRRKEKTFACASIDRTKFINDYIKTESDPVLISFFGLIEKLTKLERIEFLEKLLIYSEIDQVNLLWTILQPVLHRDNFYSSQKDFPQFDFPSLDSPRHTENKAELDLHSKNAFSRFLPSLIGQASEKKQAIAKSSKTPRLPDLNESRYSDTKALSLSLDAESLTLTNVLCNFDSLLETYRDDWDDHRKNSFLYKLVLFLDSREHYFILCYLDLRKYVDFLSLLPQPLSIKILTYLNYRDLKSVGKVCRNWEKLIQANELWLRKCQLIIKDIHMYSLQSNTKDLKKLYKLGSNLKKNWSQPKYKIRDLRSENAYDSIYCVDVHLYYLAAGTRDGSIQFWNLHTYNMVDKLTGHVSSVRCVKFVTDHLLASGSRDTTIRIWNLLDGTCTRTLYSHDGIVWAFSYRDNILVSASGDNTAKVWDFASLSIMFNLKGHTADVFCVDMDEKIIVTGSADKSIRLWDRENGKCLRSVKIFQNASIMSVSLDKGYLATSANYVATLWKIDDEYQFKKINKYEMHIRRIECLRLKITDVKNLQGFIITAAQDGNLKLFNINNPEDTKKFDIHDSTCIYCMYVDDLKIVTGSRSVKIIDFNRLHD